MSASGLEGVIAATTRLSAVDGERGHAANVPYMLSGEAPDPERTRGLETYLNTVVDGG